jgi:hypothetical protein
MDWALEVGTCIHINNVIILVQAFIVKTPINEVRLPQKVPRASRVSENPRVLASKLRVNIIYASRNATHFVDSAKLGMDIVE